MRRFEPEWLNVLAGNYYSARSAFRRSGRDPDIPLPPDEESAALFEKGHLECVQAGLRTAAIAAADLVTMLKTGATVGEFAAKAEEFSRRVADELSCEFFLQLSPAEVEHYTNWQKGWEGIIARFGDVTRDVEEMNKCLALARYTAAMFHALHVAEWGAIKLGDFIGVTDPRKGWGPTEKALRGLIANGHGRLPAPLAGRFEFLEQMHREIDSMVMAWRHKVDHAANHLAILPNTDFTPDVAEHIIGAVRIFMLRLMEGIPA